MSLASSILAHHLRLFGVKAVDSPFRFYADFIRVMDATGHDDLQIALSFADRGCVVVLQLPSDSVLQALNIKRKAIVKGPAIGLVTARRGVKPRRIRSLLDFDTYECAAPHQVIMREENTGGSCWLELQVGAGWLFLLGSNLSGDLVRYRQGNPSLAENRPSEPVWGIAGERPLYLFEPQIAGLDKYERPADAWALALAEVVSERLGSPLEPILPGGAPGAIVVTGDDDQAWLEKYDEQLRLLEGIPITYFLHPLTHHTKGTLASMGARHEVEFGLHPDALETPGIYRKLYMEQDDWFTSLTDSRARYVRNHGFLNDGYWGHLPVWLERGVVASSNLPGVDGRILNGSLLPARVVYNDMLTDHWSILTAIGDGVRFALGMDGPQSAQCIHTLAERIRESGIPGVIVLNLHPQNVSETVEMHTAVLELARGGFLPMTLGGCIQWFADRENLLSG